MEVDHREVRPPDDLRDLGDAQLVGVPSRGEGDPRHLDPLGPLLRHALLVDLLARDPVREAPQLRRPLAQGADDPLADGEVVVDEVALRVPGVGEEHLVGVRDLDEARADLELDEGRGHVRDTTGRPLTFRNEACESTVVASRRVHVTPARGVERCGSF